MTDLESFEKFFDNFKIKYKVEHYSPSVKETQVNRYTDSIILETDEGEGYSGFSLIVVFNLDGSFRWYGVFE